MKTYLITGGAGFVGSSLCLALKREHEGVRVIAFDNLRRRGSELNLARLQQGGVEFVHGDIRNPDDLASVGRIDILLDCAAEPSVLAGCDGGARYVVDTNLGGTVNCLELARRHQADFIFLSTSRVYPYKRINELKWIEGETRFALADDQAAPGASAAGVSESFSLHGGRSLYGASKLASELLIQEYMDMYGVRAVVNRCGVLTGPWQMGKVDQGFVVLWIARHIFGKALSYLGYGGSGKQVRDVLHVDDLYRLVTIQLQHMATLSGETFNVGGGQSLSISLLEMTALAQQATGRRVPIAGEDKERRADIRIYLTDHSKATRLTGWKPRITPLQLTREISQWILEHRGSLQSILD